MATHDPSNQASGIIEPSRFAVVATLAGPIGPDRTSQQWATGVETTIGITDDPPVTPRRCICRFLLRLHDQGNRADLVPTIAELVTVARLHHQVRHAVQFNPATRVGEHPAAGDPAAHHFLPDAVQPAWLASATGVRRVKPQVNRTMTTRNISQSGCWRAGQGHMQQTNRNESHSEKAGGLQDAGRSRASG